MGRNRRKKRRRHRGPKGYPKPIPTESEQKMAEILRQAGIFFIQQKRFDCISPRDPRRRSWVWVDFFIPCSDSVIEVKGSVHVGKLAEDQWREMRVQAVHPGVRFYSIWNSDVKKGSERVEEILDRVALLPYDPLYDPAS